ncbi:class I SAM-dependent methyltransferase [Timonella sp. A28]|uniref:class I SAM-dependent methyltransferase n=1 Tax=Timonella sp. A28 TaxID=3442640 RepID=UPI003EBDD74E
MALQSKFHAGDTAPQRHETDGVDKILLAEAATFDESRIQSVLVVDPTSGHLLDDLQQVFPHAAIRVVADSLVDERTIHASHPDVVHPSGLTLNDEPQQPASTHTERYPAAIFLDVDLVVMRLPKSLDALDEFACAASQNLPTHARVIAGARTKYMTHSQTQVLHTYFGAVHASLGRFKSRVLHASLPVQPTQQPQPYPRTAALSTPKVTLAAHGGVFSGVKLDVGSRFLIEHLPDLLAAVPDATLFVDAGCGTGVLSVAIASHREGAHITASDVSRAAVLSTRATAQENGVSDQVVSYQDDALTSLPTASADVVICNPPFHTGTALDTSAAHRMFEQARRVLKPGGELWTVFNSPLPYKQVLHAEVGSTRVYATNKKFTVTVSRTPQP